MPLRSPPPPRTQEKPVGQWSRPSRGLIFGVRRAPIAWLAALLVTFVLALPLYLFEHHAFLLPVPF
ncbi:MAG TPA: hypothetical protein VML55_18025 [Planctomycetaceae bacterium]|nr:hypothetical protein [Planctomycetaceae bacterium]